MRCTFAGLSGPSIQLASVRFLRVRGVALYANDDSVMATLDKDCYWHFRGDCYVRLDVSGPLVLRLVELDGGRDKVVALDAVSVAYGCLHSPSGRLAALDHGTGTWRDANSFECYSEIALLSGQM